MAILTTARVELRWAFRVRIDSARATGFVALRTAQARVRTTQRKATGVLEQRSFGERLALPVTTRAIGQLTAVWIVVAALAVLAEAEEARLAFGEQPIIGLRVAALAAELQMLAFQAETQALVTKGIAIGDSCAGKGGGCDQLEIGTMVLGVAGSAALHTSDAPVQSRLRCDRLLNGCMAACASTGHLCGSVAMASFAALGEPRLLIVHRAQGTWGQAFGVAPDKPQHQDQGG